MSYIVTKQLKSTGLAVFLAILFGGIGLFYSSILGGVIMTLLFPIIVILLFFFGKFLTLILLCCSYYLVCLIWAIAAVNIYNKKIQKEAASYQWRIIKNDDDLAHTASNDNYFEQYRKSTKSDYTLLWILLTIIIACLLFYGVHRFLNSTGIIPDSREQLMKGDNTGVSKGTKGNEKKAFTNISEIPVDKWDANSVLKIKSPDELMKTYGKNNITKLKPGSSISDDIYGNICYIYSPNNNNSLIVIFNKDWEGVGYVACHNNGSKWKFPYGIRVGDSLGKLVAINKKDIKISGFGWEGDAGSAYDSRYCWDNGMLENSGLGVIFTTNNQITYDSFFNSEVKTKDGYPTYSPTIKSNNPLLLKAGFVISRITLENTHSTSK